MGDLTINSKSYKILNIEDNWYEIILKSEFNHNYLHLEILEDPGDESIEPYTYIKLPVILESSSNPNDKTVEKMEVEEVMSLYAIKQEECEGWILFEDSWEQDYDCFYHLP